MAQVPAAPPAPLTDRDRGDIYLRGGNPKLAIRAYEKHLSKHSGDAATMRQYALALLVNRKFDEAVAVMALAYRTDPALAEIPLAASSLPDGAKGLREQVRRMSVYANRVKVGSGWLTLAVLMQAEGRTDLAARMVERGRPVGLDQKVAEAMTRALKP